VPEPVDIEIAGLIMLLGSLNVSLETLSSCFRDQLEDLIVRNTETGNCKLQECLTFVNWSNLTAESAAHEKLDVSKSSKRSRAIINGAK
jgi:hypothetical protein